MTKLRGGMTHRADPFGGKAGLSCRDGLAFHVNSSLLRGRKCGLIVGHEGPRRATEQMESDMAKLIYSAITSLDGYVEDEHGRFDWAEPDEETLAAVNAVERPIGTYLYGRRMYETMVFWETASPGQSAGTRAFAEIWKVADKVVYSRTLQRVTSAKTRIEREFDRGEVRALKETSAPDISIGGAELTGHALAAGLVDECHLFLMPILVGGGKRALPNNVRAQLQLLDELRLRSGIVHLRYRICA